MRIFSCTLRADMWFFFATLSAFFYTLLWVFARMSRGIPVSVVFTVQFLYGPFLLFFFGRDAPYPWIETWWWFYLLLPFVILPIAGCAMTYTLHNMEVTLIKPLFAISSVAALTVSSLFFGEHITLSGVCGVLLITIGILCLYHGRYGAWRTRWPWIALVGAIVFGSNAAIVAAVLVRFPHILALSGVVITASVIVGGIFAVPNIKNIPWSPRTIFIFLGLVLAMMGQDLSTLYAFTLGPSSYIVTVKRTSILLTAVIGYVFLHERDQSLMRLVVSSVLVVIGVILLV